MKWLNKFNQEGFPVLLARDPKTGKGSFSATLILLSSILVACAVFKVSKEIDGTLAMTFFTASAALYYGRNYKPQETTSITMTQETSQEPKPE